MMKPDESIQIFVPLKVRKQNGRPKIMPPATYLPSEDRTQDPHILRAIGRAWGWRRRMEAGEFNTVTDLAKAVGLAERHVSRQLRLAYLAPGVLKRLVYKREVPAVTLLKLTDVAALPWHDQPERVFYDEVKEAFGAKVKTTDEMNFKGCDVLYVCRIQKERFSDQYEAERVQKEFMITPETLMDAKEDMVILHPLPKVGEIDRKVDLDKRAKYFEQAKLGVSVRMAVFAGLFGKV